MLGFKVRMYRLGTSTADMSLSDVTDLVKSLGFTDGNAIDGMSRRFADAPFAWFRGWMHWTEQLRRDGKLDSVGVGYPTRYWVRLADVLPHVPPASERPLEACWRDEATINEALDNDEWIVLEAWDES